MSKKFRLKPEAVAFFKSDLATRIQDLTDWTKYHIDENALEEVQEPYLIFGHESKRENYSSSSLGGWDEKGSKFHFTIHFPSTKYNEHDKFSKGKITRKLMDIIQRDCDRFFEDFINNELEPKHQ